MGSFQKILKPIKYRAVDTSGNNNHGQIYSGRALEFDGLSDYLDTGYVLSSTAHTICAWAKVLNNDSDNKFIFDARDANNDGVILYFNGSEQLGYLVNNTDLIISEKYINQWIRIVATSDGSTQSLYINGQLHSSQSISETISVTSEARIGARNYSTAESFFDGMLSDVQAWDVGFSASDALYDYLNPESLALNNSGTSLTESNLKLWYPMQDGHRGQQSYILDGANTGLGEELITNGDYSVDSDPLWLTGTNGNGVEGWSISGGKATKSAPAVNSGIEQSNIFENGKTYQVNFTISGRTQGSIAVYRGQGTQLIYSSSSSSMNDSHVLYINSTSVAHKILFNGTNNFDGSIDDVSVKVVNDKHHATTEFYGDELNTQANAVTPEHSSASEANDFANWTNSGMANFGSSTDNFTQGTYSLRMTVNGDGNLAHTNFTNTVVGRTYRFKWDRRILNHAADDRVVFKIGTSADNNANGELDSWASNQATTSVIGEYKDFVATATTTFFTIREAGDSHAADLYLDNLSLMEVGVATGWTDADQQLDIPQTVLQSYNQLAWFDGHNNVCKIDDNDVYSFGVASGATANDSPFSISAWINMNDATSFPIVTKYSGSNREYRFISDSTDDLALLLHDEDNSGHWERARTTTAITSYENQWIHVVATYSGNESNSGITLYINGESQALSLDTHGSNDYAGMRNGTGELWIGGSHDDASYANGCITETSIWNKELSQAEINELYNDGKALDATIHSGISNLVSYWRNNGLAEWKDLKNPSVTTFDGTPTNVIQTILIPAGVDASRDTQGFIMNRQKTTNSLNFYTPLSKDGTAKEAAYVSIPKAPLMTNSTDVTNFSICSWVKFHQTPNQALTEMVIYDDVQESHSNVAKGLKFSITSGNALKCDVWWGNRNDSSNKDRIYCNYDLDNIDQDTITNPHSFDANGMWNGTQSSMGASKGIDYDDSLMESGNLPQGKWFHVAVTFDHDNNEAATGDTSNTGENLTTEAPFYIYVNGILVGKEGIDSNDDQSVAENYDKPMFGTPDHAAILGSDMQSNLGKPGNNAGDMRGEIDDLLIYNDTLTSREVLRIYNAGKRSHR